MYLLYSFLETQISKEPRVCVHMDSFWGAADASYFASSCWSRGKRGANIYPVPLKLLPQPKHVGIVGLFPFALAPTEQPLQSGKLVLTVVLVLSLLYLWTSAFLSASFIRVCSVLIVSHSTVHTRRSPKPGWANPVQGSFLSRENYPFVFKPAPLHKRHVLDGPAFPKHTRLRWEYFISY